MTPSTMLQDSGESVSYESPAIIYEGEITTRAGTPPEGSGAQGVDPADLFGNTQ